MCIRDSLYERDCSVQRRHQKLIEETPSPVLSNEVRNDLLDRTVRMVEKINYEGAGTVEYIYEDGKYYFLEMNTRVQVEHPVTEVVTGIDIIKEQIRIAYFGETSLKQSDIVARGHAIECRINAEDASKNFQPSPGKINMCHQPSGFRTRVDSSIYQGYKVLPYYDSMICKLICHGRDRYEAIQRTRRSLDEFVIDGITTTVELHKKLLKHKKFVNSDFNVNWLDNEKILISDFIIGNTSSHNEQFSYIREFDNEQTWLFKNEFDFKTTDIDWTEDSILKIARWRIKSVKIEGSNNKSENIYIYKDG